MMTLRPTPMLRTLWSCALCAWIAGVSVPAAAAPIQNAAGGSLGGAPLDLSGATVTLNRLDDGAAVSSVEAEIAPNAVGVGSTGNQFAYHVLPTIGPGDTGFDRVELTAPVGYANIAVTGVAVAGTDLAQLCPAPGAGQYCATTTGLAVAVSLGTRVVTTGNPVRIDFVADAPSTPGSGVFLSMVDDSVTGAVGAQAATAGNADGEPGDANSMSVEVQGRAVTTAVAEVDPASVLVTSIANAFVYDLMPTMGGGDTGFDRLQITAPAGFHSLSVTAVEVGGTAQSPNCPVPGSNEYCANVAGADISVDLGDKVTATGTPIQVRFLAGTPPTTGSGEFTSAVDDLSTPTVGAQATSAGNADGDSTDDNTTTVRVVTPPAAADRMMSTVTVEPQIVVADGVSAASITGVLRSADDQPCPDKELLFTSDRNGSTGTTTPTPAAPGPVDDLTQPTGLTDGSGVGVGAIRSRIPGVATIGTTVVTDGVTVAQAPQVFFTQGQVLQLAKTANKSEAVVGDVVTYRVEIRNTGAGEVVQVRVDDRVPPSFEYLKGSTRVNGARAPDPSGNRLLTFPLGTVPGLVDGNGNGSADPGEPGHTLLSYQLVVGSGAKPGDYMNTAVAKDVCDRCLVSNADEARVTVSVDPLFDLGTVIGKVFEDRDQDGLQGRDEAGVPGVMVALDEGTYALTDEHGRYHFPAVTPGQRLVKVNVQSLPDGAVATTEEARVLWVTPGLMAKANFGILHQYDTEAVGRAGVVGVRMSAEATEKPIEVLGNAETLSLLVNGEQARIASTDIRMGVESLEEVIRIHGDRLDAPIRFLVEQSGSMEVDRWSFKVFDKAGSVVHEEAGRGNPPNPLRWDGRTRSGAWVEGGEVYQYQLETWCLNGDRNTSSRRLLGVDRSAAVSLELSGGAFESGSATLSAEAEAVLARVAEVLEKFPDEKVVIEGHSDSVGSDDSNLELSRRRAESAASHLVEERGISRDRLVVRWHGESRPRASNDLPEGRELNRRVEIQGTFQALDQARITDQYRTQPRVQINGEPLEVDRDGRFARQLAADGTRELEVEVVSSRGRSARASLAVPLLEISQPLGSVELAYGDMGEDYFVNAPSEGGRWERGEVAVVKGLRGRTDPGNTVQIDGVEVAVDDSGEFRRDLQLSVGTNRFAIMVGNHNGCSRIADLVVRVSDRDAANRVVVLVEPIPELEVRLPPEGVPLRNPLLTVSGVTDPVNWVRVNGETATVRPDGHFTHPVTLPVGSSQLVVEARDMEGHVGRIERQVEVTNTHLFFMAIADGKVGRLHGSGFLQGAGMDRKSELYTEGRVAYYLKGVIAGKYLVTSAFDTGTDEFGQLFQDLDEAENDRFLTNLDPDKFYPVYGDSSTVVYDTESQGKFYLAVDSEELHLLAGNFALDLSQTELSAYQRTLYGGRVEYRSLSRTRYGQPDSEVVVFGAEVRQAHIRDELRGTGGSLYYLSHRDLIEGSEQVTLVVRDKSTGLTLSRQPQLRNGDYTIKYDQGRILFHRPVSSVVADDVLVDQALLSGNPVFIQVDYETRVDSFEKTAYGGRVRQQLGDHLGVGATYVKDELEQGAYELTGVDAEVRLGEGTRLVGEYSQSRGVDTLTFVSDDGGLSYGEVAPDGQRRGAAWRAAAELDVGEWFGAPERFQVGAYLKRLEAGFFSNGTIREQGSRKYGADFSLRVTARDELAARYDHEQVDGGVAERSDLGTVQWVHDHGWWGLIGELQSHAWERQGTRDTSSLAAASGWLKPTQSLTTRLEHQQTLDGPQNDQTTLGAEYQATESLSVQASGTVGDQGQSAQGGAALTLGEGRVYLNERVAEDRAGRTRSTVIGGERSLGTAGKAYTEYQWERGDRGDRAVSLTGARRTWDVIQGIRLLLSGEFSQIDSAGGETDRYAAAAGVSYAHPSGVQLSTRQELRWEQGAAEQTQYLTVNRAEIGMTPDFTLLGKYAYSLTRDRTTHETLARFEERSVGLAYRPVGHDRFNALARYTRVLDRSPLNLPEAGLSDSVADVASVEWSLEFHRFAEWVEKLAAKHKRETVTDHDPVTTHTYLMIQRLNFHLWSPIDWGVEYRVLLQREAGDRLQGWLTEVTWKALEHIRLGVGYNFTDFSDDEFSDNDYSVHGWFLRGQAKY